MHMRHKRRVRNRMAAPTIVVMTHHFVDVLVPIPVPCSSATPGSVGSGVGVSVSGTGVGVSVSGTGVGVSV